MSAEGNLKWVQPVITVASLVFGGGILYGDVQGVKREIDENKGLKQQVQVMETKLEMAEETQKRTADTLDKVADAVNKLNVTVGRLETKLEPR